MHVIQKLKSLSYKISASVYFNCTLLIIFALTARLVIAQQSNEISPKLVVQRSDGTIAGDKIPSVSYSAGKLIYTQDLRGNRIPDFSYCGYENGERPIPYIQAKVKVAPAEGDDSRRIQKAVDYVASLPLNQLGFRGAVLLEPGEFQVEKNIRISVSGIVLRGSGADNDGTAIHATGQARRSLIQVIGRGPRIISDHSLQIIDEYVPVGARKIKLKDTSGLKVGDLVIVIRPSTKGWIEAIGSNALGIEWRPGSRNICWDRVIKSLEGDSVELDVPLTTALEKRFGGGTLQQYKWPRRIEQIGIEDLTLISEYYRKNQHDEEHSWFGVNIQNAKNGWVRRIVFQHFAGGAVMLSDKTSSITVQDCISLDPVSEIGGYRRHTFFTLGQQCLFHRCWSDFGRHDFSVGHCAPGPNAFVNCYANRSTGDSGPIESWASGVLYDNVRIDGADLQLGNRWSNPTKAGWSAANCVLWQCQAANVHCDNPPTANNWAIGIWARPLGNGIIRNLSEFVKPLSLFQQQVRERIGDEAAKTVGPFLLEPIGATNPTLEKAAQFVGQSNKPARRLIDLIYEQQAGVNKKKENENHSAKLRDISEIVELEATKSAISDAESRKRKLAVQNGWISIDGKLKTGSYFTPRWWRGSIHPDEATAFGQNITRFVPGRFGTGLTDDLNQVAHSMMKKQVAGYDHHYGLWYDRRRDDHLMVRRSSGDVEPPFYEQPFARTGEGKASDGLSLYDLTKYNKWYWNRLNIFAGLCDRDGLILFHQNYFQHNVLEAGAHWADSPWRPANNVNNLPLPEPPPYIGDKRIFIAHQFYDVTNPALQELHRKYIRQCLNNFSDRSNVIQLTSAEYTGPLSFMKFWIDTIVEWESETKREVHIGLSCTKDVQDAILTDPLRGPHIDVIDIRYWTYTEENKLYAPQGGRNLSPRQHLRQQKPAMTSFASIVRAVSEYRKRYPQKAITYYADLYCRSKRDGWAVLIGGGSLPNIPHLNNELVHSILQMQPSNLLKLTSQQWCLANGDREFLIYSADHASNVTIDLPAGHTYRYQTIDPVTGRSNGGFENVQNNRITISGPKTVLWIRR